jgi:tetratricopeptide (TPR) repeat protein
MLDRHRTRAGTPLERARALAGEAGAEIARWRDAGTATALGWLFLEGRDSVNSALWFDRARGWAADSREATRGRALAALAENDFERALALSVGLDHAHARDLRRDARLGLAARHARAERHADAYRELRAAAEEGDLPRYARAQLAWSALALGQRREAGEIFARLYRDAPDIESAQGLLAAAPARPIEPALASVEPLAGMLRKRAAETAASEGRFLQARARDPGTYGDWGATTAPRVAMASAWRDKSGEEGTSRLRQRASATAEAALPLEGAMSVRARVERQTIDAGTAATRIDLDSATVGLRLERDFAMEASVGRGPSGGPLPARTVGALEFATNPAWGQVAVAGYSVPVRESVLAHAGLRDPVSGEARGGVMRRALEARGLWLEKAPWSVGGRAFTARLEGTGVRSNRHRGAELAAGYDLGLAGFAYSAASLTAGAERYAINLSGFGPGGGGYFSPQRFRRVGAGFDFMTAEGGRWMLRGRTSAGWQDKREDATESSGRDGHIQLAGSVRLTPHVHAGFAITRAVSPQYRETQGLVQLTVLLEPRLRVVSTDIPGFGR